MNFDRKIDDLLANGRISADQARVLRESLGKSTPGAAPLHLHRHLPPALPIGLAGVAAVVAIAVWLVAGQESAEGVQQVSEMMNQTQEVGGMNRSLATLLSLALFALPVLGSLIWFVIGYNGLVDREEEVLASWAQVESGYQRRGDLIPNLVETVNAYAAHERETLGELTTLRARATQLQEERQRVDALFEGAAAQLENEQFMRQLAQNHQQLGARIRELVVSVEDYPALRASDQFLALQAQLEGTENRIHVARTLFNERVGTFNAAIRRLPGSLIAGAGNFHRKAYFRAEEGHEDVVDVDFRRPAAE